MAVLLDDAPTVLLDSKPDSDSSNDDEDEEDAYASMDEEEKVAHTKWVAMPRMV